MSGSRISWHVRKSEIGEEEGKRGEALKNEREERGKTRNERRNTRAWSQSPRADPAKLFKFKFEISSGVANILFVSFGPWR